MSDETTGEDALRWAVARYFTPELWPVLIALAASAILVGALTPARQRI